MKLRCTHNSIRIRLRKSELEQLDQGLALEETIGFPNGHSLFSAAGYTALVYGPGDIAQAHSADEWVALADLDTYANAVLRILSQ